ncbi:hypothetical protein PMAYCL1PPCAC_15638 [Pristionchus mayeri]|uniref:G protein-coupled receptor n=1 Tax=Pristionchus mayeri TaxID=1317129 RepID=A0AAN5CJC0_9BILA|nr:hypothetical protein PMAYCL1PPCAC_15638 [Pristionchus mayeri]
MKRDGCMLTVSNESLRYGFGYDRSVLLDITMGMQSVLPLIDIFLLHPAMLILLSGRRKMRADIRIGYASSVIGFMFSDALVFGLRVHLLSPICRTLLRLATLQGGTSRFGHYQGMR